MTLHAYKFCAMTKNKRSEKEPGADIVFSLCNVQRPIRDFVGFCNKVVKFYESKPLLNIIYKCFYYFV